NVDLESLPPVSLARHRRRKPPKKRRVSTCHTFKKLWIVRSVDLQKPTVITTAATAVGPSFVGIVVTPNLGATKFAEVSASCGIGQQVDCSASKINAAPRRCVNQPKRQGKARTPCRGRIARGRWRFGTAGCRRMILRKSDARRRGRRLRKKGH